MQALTPWYDDGPRAGLELSRTQAEAQTGGRTTVQALLSSRRPGAVHGP
ncbi:hypothetical protein O1L55_15565 [Streptomyces albulus]|nr:hypothetical protein [Streptomyces noursei]